MKLTNAEIQKHISNLPENIKQAVLTFDWATEILGIAHEHNMQIDDADDFRHQTLLIILGITRAEDYQKNLISEVGLSPDTAEAIVQKANSRIFLQLQKRAFGSDLDIKDEGPHENLVSDPYLEPLEHADIKSVLSSEGVELVDEHEPEILDTDLHKEVSAILSESETPTPHIELEPTFTNEDKNNEVVVEIKPTSYNEPINDNDLAGITSHRINTDVLNKQQHENPNDVFTPTSKKPARDLGQGNYIAPTLDKHILENQYISKGDTINASPTRTEEIKESGGFLDHLTKEA